MMKLSIFRCTRCGKIRLVDKVNDEWICFACKQNIHKTKKTEIAEVRPQKPAKAGKKKIKKKK